MNRGLSGAQRAIAYNYEEGDVIRFTRGSKQFAIAKGDYARVEAVDREANLLAVKTPDGRRVEYNPVRLFGVEVFREELESSHKATGYSSAHPTGHLALPMAISPQSKPSTLVAPFCA